MKRNLKAFIFLGAIIMLFASPLQIIAYANIIPEQAEINDKQLQPFWHSGNIGRTTRETPMWRDPTHNSPHSMMLRVPENTEIVFLNFSSIVPSRVRVRVGNIVGYVDVGNVWFPWIF